MVERLYRSEHLELRRVSAGDGRHIIVTFDSHHAASGFDRPGFGEIFFAEQGLTALHLLTRENDWFQHAETAKVLALIAEAVRGAERVLAYGSSMGGYAAIRFASAIGAHAALALSPQFSLDRRKVPFETRWAQEQRRIRFRPELDGGIAHGPTYLAAYDPAMDQDRAHAELLAKAAAITPLPLPFAGHAVGAFLADTQLLQPLVLDALSGSVDPADLLRQAHERRSGSAHWLSYLAECQPAARPRTAIGLARRAMAIAPNHPTILDISARVLARAGCFAEAVETHHRAIEIDPASSYRWSLSKTLFAAGDLAGALEVARALQAASPNVAGYHAWAAKLYELQGNSAAQLTALREASRHDPGNRAYRYVSRRLRWRSMLSRLRLS